MSYRKHLMPSDISPSELYKAVELGTNLAEVGMDCISRQAAIETVMDCYDNAELFEVYEEKLRELPPAQPESDSGRWGKQYMIAELDLKQLISAEALKKRFKDIAKSPTNGGLFHIAEILRIIDMEKDNAGNNM